MNKHKSTSRFTVAIRTVAMFMTFVLAAGIVGSATFTGAPAAAAPPGESSITLPDGSILATSTEPKKYNWGDTLPDGSIFDSSYIPKLQFEDDTYIRGSNQSLTLIATHGRWSFAPVELVEVHKWVETTKTVTAILTRDKDFRTEGDPGNSVIITLFPSFLETLPAGVYELRVVFGRIEAPPQVAGINDVQLSNADMAKPFTIRNSLNPFGDVNEDDWFYDGVIYAYNNRLMNGVTEGVFAPDLNLSRAVVAVLFHRYVGEPKVPDMKSPFTDVSDNAWYASAVIWAAKNNIMIGNGNGRFGPNDVITREQLATLLLRFQTSEGLSLPNILTEFDWSDQDDIRDWAKDAVDVLTAQGVFRDIQNPDGKFKPQDDATRAEIAAILYRFFAR